MLYTDLNELKKALEIEPGDKSEDTSLNFLVEQASDWIGELLGRPGFSLRWRTEYYNGTGTQKLLLRCRPVFTTPTIQVVYDSNGLFGASSGSFGGGAFVMEYGKDFGLWVDQEDGSSRCALLVRNNGLWNKQWRRFGGTLTPVLGPAFGVYRVQYQAGWTVDTLPARFRAAADLLVGKMRAIMPLGMELGSESYEERAVSYLAPQKDYLLSLVKPLIWTYRNWVF